MIIRELNLIGFGKFHNRTIHLEDGLNIIYGDNETGKTTIHNFINGIFYGFLKPYAKRTIYEEEHSRYEPWSNARYSGVIRFSYHGREYRIERDFTKGNESTHVFLEDTGEDITNSIDNGNSGRVLQPGFQFFGFNDAIYSNTISIKQLGTKTEDSLANEVRDKLVNVSTTLDDELSVEKAIDSLDRALKDIGTIRATTSVYGRTHKKLEELKEYRKELVIHRDEYNKTLMSSSRFDRELKIQEQSLRDLKEKWERATVLEKAKIYVEAKDLAKEIQELKSSSQNYEKYNRLSMEDYSRGIELENNLRYIDEREIELKEELEDLENGLEVLEDIDIETIERAREISGDYLRYEELEGQRNNLIYNSNESEIQFLKRDYDNNLETKSRYIIFLIINILLSISSVGISYIMKSYWLLLVNLLLVPSAIFFISKIRRVYGLLTRISLQRDEVESRNISTKKEIENIQSILSSILDRYGVSSRPELKRLSDEIQFEIYRDRERKKEQEKNICRRGELNNKLEELGRRKEKAHEELERILEENLSRTLEEFKSNLKHKGAYEQMLKNIESKEELMKKTLGVYTLHSLEAELGDCDIVEVEGDFHISSEELKSQIDDKNAHISNIKVEKRGIDENLNFLNDRVSELVEVDEDIDRMNTLIEELDNKREAMELAKDTIEILSKDIHRKFAPTINRKVGEIVENITGGKYRGIKIDDNLEMGVINPITREIIDIDSLSGGTIDQLYFSLRFGIIDSIKNEGLPLILDDCFIQYDDHRLENMMGFLVKESEKRQIILFTCHKRETKILQDMGKEFNLVELD